jgi:hypothetical protein
LVLIATYALPVHVRWWQEAGYGHSSLGLVAVSGLLQFLASHGHASLGLVAVAIFVRI